jgi:hypothetical protein
MTKPLSLAAALSAAALLVPGAAQAAPKPAAQVLGVVTSADGRTATVRARYVCSGPTHLWVSAKQNAAGTRDPAVRAEGAGFGGAVAAWLQSHPAPQLTCDGRSHEQSFVVDQTEPGPSGPIGYGTLRKGAAWVQFCMYGATGPVTSERWAQVA